jgi:hypothetical protein
MAEKKITLRYPIEILNPTLGVPQQAPQDDKLIRKNYIFAGGAWKPAALAMERGENDFTDVCNVRQEGNHIEGVRGYASLCSIASGTYGSYSLCRAAIQLVTPYSTTHAYLMGQFWNTSALNSAGIMVRTASVLTGTEFINSPLCSFIAGAGIGNFAHWPGNTIIHCNGVETKLFGGNEIRCGAFIQATNSATTIDVSVAKDFTELMANTLQDSENIIRVNASMGLNLFLGTVLPHGQAKLYVLSGNASAANMSVKVWTGQAWSNVDTVVNGTAPLVSIPLSVTGIVSYTSALSMARPRLINGYMLYWTQINITDGSAALYHATANCPLQPVKDQWNGELLLNGKVIVKEAGTYGMRYNDYTDYMNDELDTTYMTIAPTWYASDYILVGYPVPVCGIMVDTDKGYYNHSIGMDKTFVAYCNGDSVTSWPEVNAVYDDTNIKGSIVFGQPGLITWEPPVNGTEVKTAIKGEERLYFYKIYYSAGMVPSIDVRIWRIRGVPSPRPILPYRFGFAYHNRPMLCGLDMLGEGNRVDYGQADTYAFFNGSDSSLGADGSSLYFGEGGTLTAACEVFNRVGSTLYHVALFTKDSETYILNGYDAETYQILKVSDSIGCPAPKTMDTIEIAYKQNDKGGVEDSKCVAMWLSYQGPVLFDTTNIIPMWDDIECYFDQSDSRCINHNAISVAAGWTDPLTRQYNLCIPSGSEQTTNNVWLFFDFKTNKWWKRSAPHVPQVVTKVTEDNGMTHVFGFFDNGTMKRLEYGSTYDGTIMSRYIETADIVPTGDMWDYTRMVRMKLIGDPMSESAVVSVTHAASGTTSFTSLAAFSINMAPAAFVKQTQRVNLAAWSHRLKFAISGGMTEKGLKLVAWGAEYQVEREDV